MKKWYLIYTKPNQEKIAKLNLENQSLETYLPILVTVDPEKRAVISSKVMFPRYIFSRFNIDSDRRILLIAHWDTRQFADKDPDPLNHKEPVLGANDGASGVAVLLTLMDYFSKNNKQ